MLSKNNIIKLIQTLLVLTVVWVIFFVSRSILKKEQSNITDHIPNETEWFIKIDGSKLLDKGFSSLMTKEHLNEISDLLNKRESTDSKTSSKGIDFQSDMVFFEFGLDSNKYYGAICNISNKKNFKKNVLNELSNKYAVRPIDNYAIIITSNGGIQKPYSLNNVVQKLSFGNNSDVKKLELTKSDFNIKFLMNHINGELRSDIDNSIISINGNFNLNKEDSLFNQSSSPFIGLTPKGFHISTSIIPIEFNAVIDNNLGFDFPEIVSFSLNHRSTNLSGASLSSLAFDSDLLLSFKDSISVTQVLEPLLFLNHIDSLDSISFNHAGIKHYYHLINSNHLYIGSKQFREEMLIKQNYHVLVNGSPKHLIDIKGDGFARSLLGMFPEFTASEELFNNIQNTNITLKQVNNHHLVCNGEVTIKTGHSSYMEILKFILNLQS